MSKYHIKIKRDWGRYGFWNPETRTCEKKGFVVVLDGCNCIPGAMWFKTIESAMLGIQAHMNVGGGMEWHEEMKKLENEKE